MTQPEPTPAVIHSLVRRARRRGITANQIRTTHPAELLRRLGLTKTIRKDERGHLLRLALGTTAVEADNLTALVTAVDAANGPNHTRKLLDQTADALEPHPTQTTSQPSHKPTNPQPATLQISPALRLLRTCSPQTRAALAALTAIPSHARNPISPAHTLLATGVLTLNYHPTLTVSITLEGQTHTAETLIDLTNSVDTAHGDGTLAALVNDMVRLAAQSARA